MPVNLKNQCALVIGASSGIGRETAALLAREGARVLAAARRQEKLEQLRDQLAREGHPIEIAVADASSSAQMTKLAAQALTSLGKIDIMVYATGTNTPDRALTRLTPAIWDELMAVNLSGAYYATAAVLPSMRNSGAGHLIYISSISGLVPDISGVGYQASKRGLLGLAHAIRVEEKEHGIRTCVICPGLVETELLEKRPFKTPPDLIAKALQPEDVAEAVVAVAKLPARASVPEMQLLPALI